MTTPGRYRSLALVLAAGTVAGCAATPDLRAHVPQPALVMGTFSYQYVAPVPGQLWQVHLVRLDAQPARQEYALTAELDSRSQRGAFSGMLPPGVYAFRDAGNSLRRFAANGVPMPFAVEAGEVRDLGHYALDPLTSR